MASSSKILTVSYGTFSCTVEGFEDPLETMKDTTHFFRRVVSEDRFFGAEPPQYDPEMASALLAQQIETESAEGKITLRPALGGAAAAASAGALSAALAAGPSRAPAAEDLPDDDTIEAAAIAAELVEQADDADHGETAAFDDAAVDAIETEDFDLGSVLEAEDEPVAEEAPAPLSATQESMAEKLSRIRAVVSDNADDLDPGSDVAEDSDREEEAEFDEGALSSILGDLEKDQAEDVFDTAEAEVAVEVTEAEDTNMFTDSVAALMASEDEALDAEDDLSDLDTLFDDEDDSEFDAGDDPMVSTATDTSEVDASAEDEWDAFSDADWQDDEELTSDAEAVADPKPEPEVVPATVKGPVRARVIKVKRAEFEKAVAEGQLEEVEDEAPAASQASETSLTNEDEAELARELEAVKAELAGDFGGWDDEAEEGDAFAAAPEVEAPSAEAASSDWDDDWDEDDEEDDAMAEASAPLRLDNPVTTDREWDTDFDALDAKAAAVEALQTDAETLEDSALESARKAVKMASPARAMLTEQNVEDNDTSRILDQTNEELDEPEGNRRRSAIAHLRAAVAATKADRLLGRKPDAEQQAEPYREDLANVVRPRRPQATGERSASDARPAPLKLVAEQRIPEQPAEPAAPVRPRRVSRRIEAAPAAVEAAAASGGFSDYAEGVGARELPELLEAAAAYMSFVEGRDQFSRPQLMTILRQAEGAESSREDRLRSFGQLLREGKIEKTSGGRYTASDRISFKPRKAG
ncbi:hypothetical protein [Thalassococcus lentus]|uniref:Lipoprotein n=1 Tax=Thalassococcus lentus TaxID=1210524 RepID=A0ABT4XU65_9RHOB|nr:hypothetical protein [Thalassococcus lentus]MDA7425353.1 hypothetical protein [Thalassococcus lentus]